LEPANHPNKVRVLLPRAFLEKDFLSEQAPSPDVDLCLDALLKASFGRGPQTWLTDSAISFEKGPQLSPKLVTLETLLRLSKISPLRREFLRIGTVFTEGLETEPFSLVKEALEKDHPFIEKTRTSPKLFS